MTKVLYHTTQRYSMAKQTPDKRGSHCKKTREETKLQKRRKFVLYFFDAFRIAIFLSIQRNFFIADKGDHGGNGTTLNDNTVQE